MNDKGDKIMKSLNKNEMKVLKAFAENASGNGYDFGWTDEMEKPAGLTDNQIKGYISQLQSKEYIYCCDDPDFPGMTTFDEKFATFINGHDKYGHEMDREKLEAWLASN